MSRRNRPRRRNLQQRNALRGRDPTTESAASKSYTAGRAVRYKWRIAGPTTEPVVYNRSELPEGSKLTDL